MKKYNGRDIKEAKELYDKLIDGSLSIADFELQTNLKEESFRTLHYKAIYMLFASQRLIFTGFGLRDDFLTKIVDDIKEDFDPLRSNHFALMSNNGSDWNEIRYLEEKQKWKSKGIELVFFNDDKDYGGIVKFFEGLSQNSFLPDPIQPNRPVVETNIAIAEPDSSENKQEDENVNSKILANTRKIAEEIKRK